MHKVPYFVGLDIGTSRVRCVIGMPEINNTDSPVSVIGIGSAENNGMRKGCVTHPEDVSHAIIEAVAEAERMAGIRVPAVMFNVNGANINAQSSKGLVSTNSQDKIITDEDRLRVEEQATAINMPNNRDIIQVFAKEYRIDGQGGIKDPVGMYGVRLEVDTLVVTAGIPSINSIVSAVNSADIDIKGRTVSGVAAAEAVLDRRQKESGTAVIDIGASTTNVAIIQDGEIVTVGVIPIGGINITHDLAIGLKADLDFAEKMKKKLVSLKPDAAVSKQLRVSHEGKTYDIDTAKVYDIVVPRFEEIFEEVDKIFAKVGKSKALPGGIVLVGGVARTPGIADFASEQFQLHTRIGSIKNVGGLTDTINNQEYSTAVGLMLMDCLSMLETEDIGQNSHNNREKGLFTKIKNTFKIG